MEPRNIAFRSPGHHGYSVEYSPYSPSRLAVATAQNYGIAGGGSLYIIDVDNAMGASLVKSFQCSNGLFDVTWSENNENVLLSASGDGSIQLWDLMKEAIPVIVFKEHTKEVYGVDWSQTRDQHLILSASWDKTVKLWDPQRTASLATFAAHNSIVYCAIWSPLVPGCFASAAGDGVVRLWDVRRPQSPRIAVNVGSEVVSCDWCKYDKNIIMDLPKNVIPSEENSRLVRWLVPEVTFNILVAGGVDGKISGWDLRKPNAPAFLLSENGHTHAVRRVKCSPHHQSVIASCSYDFTTRVWDFASQPAPIETIQHHTEFVCGVDFNLHIPGQLADCSWDEKTIIFHPACLRDKR